MATKTVGTKTKVETSAPADSNAPVKPRRKRKAKPQLLPENARNGDSPIEVDEEGRMMTVPTNWRPGLAIFRKEAFTEVGLWYEWKAHVLNGMIQKIKDKQEELLLKAREAREELSPTEKALKKRAQLAKQMAKLDALLAEEGIEMD